MKRTYAGILAFLTAVGGAVAQEGAAPMKISLDIGATLTDGNSESTKANASLNVQAEKEKLGSILGGIQVNYGESKVDGEEEKDLDNAKAFINVKKTATPMTFFYFDTSALYDNIADIDYRLTAGPGGGFYAVKSARDTLSFEAGPTYVWERVAEEDDDYLAVRVAQRYEHVFAPGTRFWQSAEYLPEAGDFGNHLLNAEVGCEAALNSRMSLRLVLQDKYDSEPGPDLERNDILFIAGVSFKL